MPTGTGSARNPQKFLVTGATGFVGGYLMEALVKTCGPSAVTALFYTSNRPAEEAKLKSLRDSGVALLECDLIKLPSLALPVPAFDVVYHLAGFTESENPRGPFEVNSAGTRNLLEWLGPHLKGKRLIYTGTVAGIDAPSAAAPITEATPCHPKTLYGRSKVEGEKYIRAAAENLGFDYTILRLCTIVGKGYRPGGMFGVLPPMIQSQALSARLNWPGRGSYLGMADLVRLLLAVPACAETANKIYLLGNGEGPSFGDVIATVARVLELPHRPVNLPAGLWRALYRLAWALAGCGVLPHRIQIACWRAAHIIGHGLWVDNSSITRLLQFKYQSLGEMLRSAYEK